MNTDPPGSGSRVALTTYLNIQINHGGLDLRRNFYCQRVVEVWNKIGTVSADINKCTNEGELQHILKVTTVR